MNTRFESMPYPDSTSVAPELEFRDCWDVQAVSALIRSKCDHGETPSFLLVGRKESGMLRDHLAEVFGAAAVTTLHDTYYMGLKVVEINCDSFIFAGGRKAGLTLQGPLSRRPECRDFQAEMLWQSRI